MRSADHLWRSFRSWPIWAQIVGWLFAFWVLVPLLIWRTTWHRGTKIVLTVAFVLVVGATQSPDEPAGPPVEIAEETEQVEDPPEEPVEAIPEETPTPTLIAAEAPGVPGRVVRVIDGDTVEASYRGRTASVRLIGIDTPETVHPSQPVGCLGKEASAFTEHRLEGKRIRLEFDVERRDRYGRLLAYVWVGDKLFNEVIVSKGFAQVSTYPPNVKYENRFRAAQRKARNNDRGLWAPGACPEPVPPQPATGGGNCDANYTGTCVPIVDYDLDCGDISGSVKVVGEDKHGFDGDGDGYGCESN